MPRKTRVDCVAIQHRGGEAVNKIIGRMSREEEARYWAEQTAEFRTELEAARKSKRQSAR